MLRDLGEAGGRVCTLSKDDVVRLLQSCCVDTAAWSHIRLPGSIDLSVRDGVLHLVVNRPTGNMQTDAAAFEAWVLAIKACLGDRIKRVQLDFPPLHLETDRYVGNPARLHLNRFLFRLAGFSAMYSDWCSLSTHAEHEVNSFMEWFEQSDMRLNQPVARTNPGPIGREHRVEAWLIGQGKRELCSLLGMDEERVFNQLPVGVYHEQVSRTNAVFPGGSAAIDLWGVDSTGKTLHLIELKQGRKPGLGVISQALFYAQILHRAAVGDNNISLSAARLHQEGRGIVVFRSGRYERIALHFLAERFHPLFSRRVLSLLNDGLSQWSAYADQVIYDYETKSFVKLYPSSDSPKAGAPESGLSSCRCHNTRNGGSPANQFVRCLATFDSVGHGLFYHAHLQQQHSGCSFAFVYDCGCLGSKRSINQTISELSPDYDTLDMLVLSHLDADHVNGLGALLKGRHCRVAVLPYLYPEVRLALAARYFYDKPYVRFIMDPISFFVRRGVTEIVVLGQEEDPNLGSEVPEAPLKEDIAFRKTIECLEGKPYGRNVRFVGNSFRHTACETWVFKLYNLPLSQTDLGALRTRLALLIRGDAPGVILANGVRRKELADEYKKYAVANQTSIVMYHGPENCRGTTNIEMWQRWHSCVAARMGRSSSNIDHVGTLLLGDLNTGDARCQDLYRHFSAQLGEVAVALVPHHGSRHSWDTALLAKLPDARWVASHPELSSDHPHATVRCEICLNSCEPMYTSSEFLAVRAETTVCIGATKGPSASDTQ